MSVLVVDASVAVKWFVDEEHTGVARTLLTPQFQLCAPDFFLLEMDNVFCRRVRRKEFSRTEAEEARSTLRRFPVSYHGLTAYLDRAFNIAAETSQTPYDCLYLALAEAFGTCMVTADRRFFERMSGTPFADHVLWVEDVGAIEAEPARERRDAKRSKRKRRKGAGRNGAT